MVNLCQYRFEGLPLSSGKRREQFAFHGERNRHDFAVNPPPRWGQFEMV